MSALLVALCPVLCFDLKMTVPCWSGAIRVPRVLTAPEMYRVPYFGRERVLSQTVAANLPRVTLSSVSDTRGSESSRRLND